MRLDGPDSKNVEDRRGQRGGGGGMGRVAVGGGFGAIVLLLLSIFLGVDVTGLGGVQTPAPSPSAAEQRQIPPGQAGLQEDEARRFISRVLAETEQVWNEGFQALGRRYEEPTLVLYSGSTRSGCGAAQAQVGPFYCPVDKRVYIDLDFMGRLLRQLGAQRRRHVQLAAHDALAQRRQHRPVRAGGRAVGLLQRLIVAPAG